MSKKGIFVVGKFRQKGFVPVWVDEKVNTVGEGVGRAREAIKIYDPEYMLRLRVQDNGRIKFQCRMDAGGNIEESVVV